MMNKEFEIYIHIPFCVQKCYYCDFLSAPASCESIEAYSKALGEEIQYMAAYAGGKAAGVVRSVFIGGGTPSYIDEIYIEQLMGKLSQYFSIQADAEITIECNPGTLTMEKLAAYKQAGINRISLGLQSTDNRCLHAIGRIHTWEAFLESYHLCRQIGFSNINIDLMSALPGQTVAGYIAGLQKVIALKPEHISAYSLIVEPDTPMEKMVASGACSLPTEEADRLMYEQTGQILKEAGYVHYEISNYSKPGRECRHNCGYWERVPYLGFGLGASSLWEETRWKNTSDLKRYGKLAGKEDIREEIEQLSVSQQMEEFMFLGLRMEKGVSKTQFFHTFGVKIEAVFGKTIEKFVKTGFLQEEKDRVFFSKRGIDVSNSILCEFLLD
jgi:oxygen-independent coproporphyrinogen-3 oxidase